MDRYGTVGVNVIDRARRSAFHERPVLPDPPPNASEAPATASTDIYKFEKIKAPSGPC
jgi:hypothetical protein